MQKSEPQLVALRGERYLLYVAGTKRGHADALHDASNAVGEMAARYAAIAEQEGAPESAVDQTAIALMQTVAKQLGGQARVCSESSARALVKAIEAFDAHPELVQRNAKLPPALPQASKYRWVRLVRAVKAAW